MEILINMLCALLVRFLPIGMILLIILLCELYFKIFLKIRNKIYELETYKDIETLHRDFNCTYNPSALSILINNELTLKSISADIMNLYAKKILDIEETLKDGKKECKIKVNVMNTDNLEISESDKYILNTIFKEKDDFDFNIWKEKVNNEYNNLNFSKLYKKFNLASYFKMLFKAYLILSLIYFFILKDIKDALLWSVFTTSLFFSIMSIIFSFKEKETNKRRYLNKNGKNELKKWIKLKKFIQEYTLIGEKNIKDIVIYEKYIPYAVVLDINNNYKGTIYSIFSEEAEKLLKEIKGPNIIDKNLTF